MNPVDGSVRRTQEEPPTYEAENVDVQRLIRHLVKQVTDRSAALALPESGAQEIILDEEVDGIRCLLVRLQSKSERTQVMLSPREQEIARMVAEGYPNKTIAAVLDISSWTVCTHLRRIFAKLNVRSRAAMVARLLEEGSIKDHSKPYEARTASLR
jgi:two-component system nitrate/nitrite response regulator NarL